jgi:hypothetical protein
MEPSREEAKTKEPSRRGAWPLGRFREQRGQEARQQTQRPQGRAGQKPQEDAGGSAQCAAAEAWTPHEWEKDRTRHHKVNAAMAAIRARFGTSSIGLGDRGIRYIREGLAPTFAGNQLSAPSGDQGEYFVLGNGR